MNIPDLIEESESLTGDEGERFAGTLMEYFDLKFRFCKNKINIKIIIWDKYYYCCMLNSLLSIIGKSWDIHILV